MPKIFLLCLIILILFDFNRDALYGQEVRKKATILLEGEAEKYEKEKEFEKALEIWKKLHVVAPESAEYSYRIGQNYLWQDNLEEAEVYFKQSLERDPEHAEAKLRLSYLYFWRGNLEKALDGFNDLLQRRPDNLDAKEGLEKVQTRMKRQRKYPRSNPRREVSWKSL
jgi:tetratricopeptide (TPR) repeat protein